MLDPEAVIVKGGILVLATLSVIRLIWNDYNNLVCDIRKGREKDKEATPPQEPH